MEKKVDAPRRPKLGRGSRQIPDRRRHGDARTPALCVSKTDRDAIVAHFAPWAARMLRVQHSPPPPAKRMRKRRGAHKKMRREKKKKRGPLRANLLPLCAQAASEAAKVESGPPGGSGGPPKGPWARQRSRRARLRGLRPLGRPSYEGLRVRAVRI